VITKIISGGQTGVDRAGLDAAIALGIEHGGWCPRGRLAEDGRVPDRYRLSETPSAGYEQRTEWNIIEATATLVLYDGRVPMSPGTRKTLRLANAVADARTGGGSGRWHRYCEINLHPEAHPAGALRYWLEHVKPDVRILNVAGPRESKAPGIGAATLAMLIEVLR
jgi:hypothetical protein